MDWQPAGPQRRIHFGPVLVRQFDHGLRGEHPFTKGAFPLELGIGFKDLPATPLPASPTLDRVSPGYRLRLPYHMNEEQRLEAMIEGWYLEQENIALWLAASPPTADTTMTAEERCFKLKVEQQLKHNAKQLSRKNLNDPSNMLRSLREMMAEHQRYKERQPRDAFVEVSLPPARSIIASTPIAIALPPSTRAVQCIVPDVDTSPASIVPPPSRSSQQNRWLCSLLDNFGRLRWWRSCFMAMSQSSVCGYFGFCP
jgi:hypothetical protein